jgi:hypothetical protein
MANRRPAVAAQIPAFGRNDGNAALVDANTRTLRGGCASASAFAAAAGTTLEIAGGTFTLTGGIYNAADKTLVAAGDLGVDSAIASGAVMTINGRTLELALNLLTAIVFAGTQRAALDHSGVLENVRERLVAQGLITPRALRKAGPPPSIGEIAEFFLRTPMAYASRWARRT